MLLTKNIGKYYVLNHIKIMNILYETNRSAFRVLNNCNRQFPVQNGFEFKLNKP